METKRLIFRKIEQSDYDNLKEIISRCLETNMLR